MLNLIFIASGILVHSSWPICKAHTVQNLNIQYIFDPPSGPKGVVRRSIDVEFRPLFSILQGSIVYLVAQQKTHQDESVSRLTPPLIDYGNGWFFLIKSSCMGTVFVIA